MNKKEANQKRATDLPCPSFENSGRSKWDYECKTFRKTCLRFLFMLSHLWWSECLGLLILKSAIYYQASLCFGEAKVWPKILNNVDKITNHTWSPILLHQSPFSKCSPEALVPCIPDTEDGHDPSTTMTTTFPDVQPVTIKLCNLFNLLKQLDMPH